MNITYHMWLTITVNHHYFTEGRSNLFNVVPTSETALVFKNYQILLHRDENRFSFIIGLPEGEVFDPILAFIGLSTIQLQLVVHETYFYNYTDVSEELITETMYFESLEGQEHLTMVEPFPTPSILEASCIGVIQLDVTKLFNGSIMRALEIDFNARKVIVNYSIILPDNENFLDATLSVIGLQGEMFSVKSMVQIGDRSAHVFVSKETILMHNNPVEHRTLEISYTPSSSNNREILKIQLPNPTMEELQQRQNNDGVTSFLSTSIVYV